MAGVEYGENLYPVDQRAHDKLLGWTNLAFQAAQADRRTREDKWQRYYRLYRNYVEKKQGDWRSRVFMPEVFQTIETILPRLVAQLPTWLVKPVGPEDVEAAKMMEEQIRYAADQSGLYMELLAVHKDALMYGTGILKTYRGEIFAYGRKMVPVFSEEVIPVNKPLVDPEAGPMRDPDGNPVIDTQEITVQVPTGMEPQRYRFAAYDGPMAQCVDLFNFWVAPEATDLDTARYVNHRTFQNPRDVAKRIEEGIYQLPDGVTEQDLISSSSDRQPHMERMESIGIGADDPSRKDMVIDEFWTYDGQHNPGRVITRLNEKYIMRVQENPFDHAQKPFVRFVDYYQPHEFYGIGEIEVMEGIQDLINALTNHRIDNYKLTQNAMFAVNENQLVDLGDLVPRPGGVIRLRGDGMRPEDVIQRIDLGDISQNAFAEVDTAKAWSERATGNSSYQQGTDTPSMNDTATGVAMLQEAGGARNSMKVKTNELLALRRLGRHFGSILQQFSDKPRLVRRLGPQAQEIFDTVDPEALMGALDYDIEPASIMQSETVKREQAMSLFNTLMPVLQSVPPGMALPPGVEALVEDVLDAFGKKDKQRFLQAPQPMLPPGVPGMPPANGNGGIPPEILQQLGQPNV